jgi:hypothetical protein
MPKPDRPIRIEASDPRADNRRRVIDLGPEAVVIRRAVKGVAMAIRVRPDAYRGVTLRLTGLSETGFRYEVRLLHRDPDLRVPLAEGEDRLAIEAQWRAWARFLRLPALVGRFETGDETANLAVVEIPRRPWPRRRGKTVTARRARFLVRRKVGRSSPAPTIHCDPRVLFPGSKADR